MISVAILNTLLSTMFVFSVLSSQMSETALEQLCAEVSVLCASAGSLSEKEALKLSQSLALIAFNVTGIRLRR